MPHMRLTPNTMIHDTFLRAKFHVHLHTNTAHTSTPTHMKFIILLNELQKVITSLRGLEILLFSQFFFSTCIV